jgi:hypothetical protein
MHRGLQEQAKQMMTNISWVEEAGELGRRTVKQYAADQNTTEEEIQDRYAATGLLDCNGSKSTAQLTGDNSTISTVAHDFTNPLTCKKKSNGLNTCTFTVITSQGEQTVDVSEMIGQGFKCPASPNVSDDWAVLKLKNPIRGVKPYRLPKKSDRLKVGDKLVSVNAYNNDVFTIDRKTKEKKFPKTIEDCTRKIDHEETVTASYIESTCDLAGGASGGSILKPGSDVLMAIHRGNDDSAAETAAGRAGHSVHKPYRESEWASYHILVADEFLDTLRRATGQRD